jgi:hypothetical protein
MKNVLHSIFFFFLFSPSDLSRDISLRVFDIRNISKYDLSLFVHLSFER